jgi:hypothetical protein
MKSRGSRKIGGNEPIGRIDRFGKPLQPAKPDPLRGSLAASRQDRARWHPASVCCSDHQRRREMIAGKEKRR